MPSYLKQYTDFSRGIAQQLDQSRKSITTSLSDLGRLQAQKNQAEAKRQAKVREQITKDQVAFDGSDMWDWQADITRQQIAATGELLENGTINSVQYATMTNQILTDVQNQKTNYRAEVGNPETSDPTESTYYGYLKAIDEWVTKGVNVYEDDRVIIKGLDQGDDGVAQAQMDLNSTFRIRNKGKSQNEQVLGGFYDENLVWTYKVGNPEDPSSIKNISAKDFLANNEGPNAFLREMTMVDSKVMSDHASSKQAENFIGDGGSPEMEQYYNVQFGRDRHFRRDVFDQFGPSVFAEEELRTMRDIFVKLDESGMSFDGSSVSMQFDENNVNSAMFKKVWEMGQDNFVGEYSSRHKKQVDEDKMKDRSPMMETINKKEALKAYKPKGFVSSLFGSAFPGPNPELLSNIDEMVRLPERIRLSSDSRAYITAAAMDANGDMIAKVTEYSDVTTTPELSEAQILAGMQPESETQKNVEQYYYVKLGDTDKNNVFLNIGRNISPKGTNNIDDGHRFFYDKYMSNPSAQPQAQQEEVYVDPPAQRAEPQQQPSSSDVKGSPLKNQPVPKYYDPETEAGEAALITRLLNAYGNENDSLSMVKWLKQNPGQIAEFMKEIDKGNLGVWMSKDAFSPIELVFEKQE